MTHWERLRSVTEFLEEIDRLSMTWAVKRLSGNDTGLTGGHQAGIYLPRGYFEKAFPELCRVDLHNPHVDVARGIVLGAGFVTTRLRATYYNSKYHPELGHAKKYDEFRLTGWGGRNSPVQDPDNTGCTVVIAVTRTQDGIVLLAWVASSLEEEATIEDWLGDAVEPGRCLTRDGDLAGGGGMAPVAIPAEWYEAFPSGREIFEFVTQQVPRATWTRSVDDLLVERRRREFVVFKEIEQKHVQARLNNRFETVEQFVTYANSVTNRRKSRAGTSLELNLGATFRDEGLAFEAQALTENRKRPDFLFPNARAYHDTEFPLDQLQMMAAKTCCRDRWRQVVNEAGRIRKKHLFTLQEGVTSNQLREMRDEQVILVVPEPHLGSFPEAERPGILTLGGFVEYVKSGQAGMDLAPWIT